jgi:hypothetical protein
LRVTSPAGRWQRIYHFKLSSCGMPNDDTTVIDKRGIGSIKIDKINNVIGPSKELLVLQQVRRLHILNDVNSGSSESGYRMLKQASPGIKRVKAVVDNKVEVIRADLIPMRRDCAEISLIDKKHVLILSS